MKILFQSRQTLFSVSGGDTTQVLKTAEALRNLGHTVDISTEISPDLTGYDIVHLFNFIRPQETNLQARNARSQGKPVALSTIYVDYSEYEKKASGLPRQVAANLLGSDGVEYLKVLARAVVNREMNRGTFELLRRGFRRLQLETLLNVDVLLPNSHSEHRRLLADFPTAASVPHVVVPNSVDLDFCRSYAEVPSDLHPHRDGVLCVGRIEGSKNQLNLVRAMEGLPFPLTLIGKPAPNSHSYFQSVQKAAGKNVHILGPVEHVRLPEIYRASRVHALVSWMETTGLSSLEAAASGCRLVITDKGDTREYFGDFAEYCDPEDVTSIRDALIRAHSSEPNPTLSERVRTNFIWPITAEKTLEGYRLAMKNAMT